MSYDQFDFYHLDKEWDPQQHIVAKFYFQSSQLDWDDAVHAIAGESSIGTWTKIAQLSDEQYRRLAPKIVWQHKQQQQVKIAYPLDLFELGSIPQLLSSIGGNIFSMKVVEHLRLLDIELPDKYINLFAGPQHGIDGIRKITQIKHRPLVGSIVKPKVGLTAEQHADAAYTLWKHGVDVVKDDENLTDQDFNQFKQRVKLTLKARKRVEKETGHKKIAVLNVTAPYDEALKRAKFIKKNGGRCMMLDIVSMGWSAVQSLRHQNLGLIIHGHRAGHSMFTRYEQHGMTMYVLAKLARLAGIDQLHTGTVVGKMEGQRQQVQHIDEFITSAWADLKPMMPIASGGLHPGLVPPVVKYIGQDVIINFGGGIFGHPDGLAQGAKAARQAVDAAVQGIDLQKYASDHPELLTALKYWKT